MPQLDVSTYSSQLFWLFLSFVTLYFVIKTKIIPLFEDLRQKRWDNIHGTQRVAERFMKEGNDVHSESKKMLEIAKKKSNDILVEADREAKSHFSDGRLKFLSSVQDRLLKTKSILKDQELEVEKNIIEGVGPLTVDIVVKSSNNVLSKDKVRNYLNNNVSSIRKTLNLRSNNV